MPANGLEDAIVKAATRVTKLTPDELLQMHCSQMTGVMRRLISGHKYAHLIEECLEQVPFFQTTSSEQLINKIEIAKAATERLILGDAPALIAQDILSLTRQKTLTRSYVRGIQGLELASRIYLEPRVYLDNAKNLRRCFFREQFFGISPTGETLFHNNIYAIATPHVALVIQKERPVNVLASETWPAGNDFPKLRELERKVFASLALSGPCAPEAVSETQWEEHPAVGYQFSGGGAGYSGFLHSEGEFDGQIAKTIYDKIGMLPNDVWEAIDLACQRIIRSRHAFDNLENRAIDLRIALEIILRHHEGSGNQEIAYKIATRGAILLADKPNERVQIFKKIKDGYSKTSTAIHAGKLPYDKNIDRIKDLDEMLCSIVKKIIDLGNFPNNWDEFVLGAGMVAKNQP